MKDLKLYLNRSINENAYNDIDIDQFADEVIAHCFEEEFDKDEIQEMIENQDDFIFEKLVEHGHSSLFDDEGDVEQYVNMNYAEIWDALQNALENYDM